MKSCREPAGKPRLRDGQIDAGHPDVREPERASPAADVGEQGVGVDGSPRIGHDVIVETPADLGLSWASEHDTAAFARRLASTRGLEDAFITLRGDLGAGKTTLARHLLRALGVQGTVKSPTFSVVEPYRTPDGMDIWHFDFYRFSDAHEWEDAGFRDLFASHGLKLAEWPERAADCLPDADLDIAISVSGGAARHARVHAGSGRGIKMLQQLAS